MRDAIDLETPYLFYEIWVPKRPRYTGAHGWTSIIGDLIAPLIRDINGDERRDESICWFVQEGRWFQVCFASWWSDTESKVKVACKARGFRIKRLLKGGIVGGALCGTRWNAARRFGTRAERERSLKLVTTLHHLCGLFIDTLVKHRDGTWRVQAPSCKRQNPHGNLFESFTHLVANITGAQFDVQLQARTRWMHEGYREASVICHL